MTRLPILLFLLLIVLGFSGWLAMRAYFPQVEITVTPGQPNAIAENVIVSHYDETGMLKAKLNAPQLVNFPDNKTAKIEKPKVTIYDAAEQPWTITADHATTINGMDKIELYGNVQIHQPLGAKNPAVDISTSQLTLYPRKAIAETKQIVNFSAVTSDHATVRMQSHGAQVQQKLGVIHLLSHVETYYEAAK